MRIITRTEWGARHPNGFGTRRLPATQAWLHHSVTIAPDLVPPFDDDHAAIRELEQIGQARFGGGISYTRLFTPAGLIFEGHGVDRVGSHTANRNSIAVGYCLVGNYENAHPTEAQLRALAWCLQHDHRQGWLDAPRLDGAHRDLKSTACPGRHAYAAIDDVNRLAAGPPITDHPHPREDDMFLRNIGPDGKERWAHVTGRMIMGLTPGELVDARKLVDAGKVVARWVDTATWDAWVRIRDVDAAVLAELKASNDMMRELLAKEVPSA